MEESHLFKEIRLTSGEVQNLIEARTAARKAKNFAESDRIRDELLAMGVVLEGLQGRHHLGALPDERRRPVEARVAAVSAG